MLSQRDVYGLRVQQIAFERWTMTDPTFRPLQSDRPKMTEEVKYSFHLLFILFFSKTVTRGLMTTSKGQTSITTVYSHNTIYQSQSWLAGARMPRDPHPLATLPQILQTPSAKDGIPAQLESDLRTAGCMLVQEAGVMLEL